MDYFTLEKQMEINDEPLVREKQKFKECDQQTKEQATQTESVDKFCKDDQKQNKSLSIDLLKIRIEELETESLIKDLNYKELREEFTEFKSEIMMILEVYNISMTYTQNIENVSYINQLIIENAKKINDIEIELTKIKIENERLMAENTHLHKMLMDKDSFSDQFNNMFPNLENFGEIFEGESNSSFSFEDDKRHMIFIDDDNSMSFRRNKNKLVRSVEDVCDHDVEEILKKEVVEPSSSSNQQFIGGKLNKGKNKYDPLLETLESIQNPVIDSKQKTSSLNPYATSFVPGKNEILYSNQEKEIQEIQENCHSQMDSSLNDLLEILL